MGEFIPNDAPTSSVEIAHSGTLTKGRSSECTGTIRSAYVAGLPADLAIRLEMGMRSAPTDIPWVRGVYRVTVAGYDEVDSNPITFERLGGLLRIGLSAAALGKSLDDADVHDLVAKWG